MNEDPTADELRRLASEILDRAEFADPERSALDRFFGWLGDRIGDLFSGLGGGDVGGIMLLLLVIAAVSAVLWTARRGRPRSVSTAAVTRKNRAGVRTSRAAEWRERADAARSVGNWGEAVRCEHRYLASALDDQAWLRERDHRTATELLADVRSEPEIAGGLSDVTASFEGVWYGSSPADARLVEVVRSVSESVLAKAERRR